MRALQFLPLALLFLTSAVPTKAQEGAAEARVVVREGAPLTVECALRVEQPAQWRRDGGAVPSDMRSAEAPAGGQFTARLHAAAARASHAGLYSCGSEPWQRVRVLVQPAPAPAPASAPAVVAAPPEAAAKVPETTAIVPIIENPHPLFVADLARQFTLNCSKLQNAEPDTVVWKKNGTEVEKIVDLANRYQLEENGAVFHLTARSTEDDFGTYTCGKRGVSGEANGWEVRMTTHAKLPPHTNVVEGQKLKLQCKLIGKPYPKVTWNYRNNTEEKNGTDVSLVLGDRAIFQKSEQDVENGELIIESAQRSDAGVYTCVPENGVESFTTVRVKDMYAALWPFLGICAEVFVLCVIILVYEKRRTKPELDDSDTDNHEQKKS